MMPTNSDAQRLKFIAEVADLKELEVLALVQKRLEAGGDPLAIIEDCQEGWGAGIISAEFVSEVCAVVDIQGAEEETQADTD